MFLFLDTIFCNFSMIRAFLIIIWAFDDQPHQAHVDFFTAQAKCVWYWQFVRCGG